MHIHDYYYKPTPVFFLLDGETPSSVFTYGFELEVKRNPRFIHEMEEIEDFVSGEFTAKVNEMFQSNPFYVKHDGSVSDGFEIVSHPMSWGWFIENRDKFKQLIRFLQQSHYVSEKGGQCGLHFHIGDKHIENIKGGEEGLLHYAANIQKIMNYYKAPLISFARRRQRQMHWCQFRGEGESFEYMKSGLRNSLKNRNANRYMALNTTNESTLEVRLMRGTTNWKTFFLTFNLVKNLAEFSLNDNSLVYIRDLIFNGLNHTWRRIAEEYIDGRDIDLSCEPVLTESA